MKDFNFSILDMYMKQIGIRHPSKMLLYEDLEYRGNTLTHESERKMKDHTRWIKQRMYDFKVFNEIKGKK